MQNNKVSIKTETQKYKWRVLRKISKYSRLMIIQFSKRTFDLLKIY